MNLKEIIKSHNDVLEMLDSFLREPTPFWDTFYSNRNKQIPFFINKPDENLVSYFEKDNLESGKVLELGCGPGRNAIYFAQKGCDVDAVDFSKESLEWAKERAEKLKVEVNFIQKNIFDLLITEESYDIVYDSGCFHHIAPHRRMDYIDLVKKSLKPEGYFAITCFIQGGELCGETITDWDVYRLKSLNGGLGFTEEKLRYLFSDFKVIEIRKMIQLAPESKMFGVSGLLTALFQVGI